MSKCPYCGTFMEKKAQFVPLSAKRKEVFDYVMGGGREGVKFSDLQKKLFPKTTSDVTIRTVIHYLNKKIHPSRIISKGGRLHLERVD